MTDQTMPNASHLPANPDEPLGVSPSRRLLLLVALAITIMHLAGAMGYWRPKPDSALYLGLARSLAEGEGFRFNDQAHGHVTPGLPLVLAGLRLAFGPESYRSANLLMILCGLGGLVLTYAVVRRLGGASLALATVLITAFSFPYYIATHEILTDGPFFLLFWGLLYGYVRSLEGSRLWLLLTAALSTAGLLIRAPGLLVLVPLAVAIVLAPRQGGARPGRWLAAGAVLVPMILLATAMLAAAFFMTRQTPPYLEVTLANQVESFSGKWFLLRGLAAFPLTLMELFISQDGMGSAPVAAVLTALALTGAGSLWRTRQRFVPATAFLAAILLAFIGGKAAVRVRYLLPVQPMLIYLVLQGLCRTFQAPRARLLRVLVAAAAAVCLVNAYLHESRWYYFLLIPAGAWLIIEAVVAAARRWAGRGPAVRRAVAILAGLSIAVSAPKVFRDAFYYSRLAPAQRYYEKYAHGSHAETFPLARALQTLCPPGRTIAMPPDKVSMFHYLTGRRVVCSIQMEQTAAQAEMFVKFVRRQENLGAVVLDRKDSGTEFVRRAIELLDTSPNLRRDESYKGERYVVYVAQIASASKPAPGPEAP